MRAALMATGAPTRGVLSGFFTVTITSFALSGKEKSNIAAAAISCRF
jgi:hypothetical protein